MGRRTVLALLVVLPLAVGALYLWSQSILASDMVRRAVEGQLSTATGQRVTIGGIRATVLPRVNVTLVDVRIGPDKVRIDSLSIVTDLRALLTRRVEHASLHVVGARVALPLPPFTFRTPPQPGAAAAATPLALVSVDDIRIENMVITSGRRTLNASAQLAMDRERIDVRNARVTADGSMFTIAGAITNPSGPHGTLSITAESLDVLDLMAFLGDFAEGAAGGDARTEPAPASPAASPDLTIDLSAARAQVATLALRDLGGRARVTRAGVTLDPIGFAIFDGRYDGALVLSFDDVPRFRMTAALADLDAAAVMAFVGQPDLLTGRVAGRLDITGRGTTASEVRASMLGQMRIDITRGTLARLGLVRTVVLATSMRSDSPATPAGPPPTESFTRLGATLDIERGVGRTADLRFESDDVMVSGGGTIALGGEATTIDGRVQLSEALSRQAGRDLIRYTQEDGRVTLPVRVTGPASNLAVRLDLSAAARRALINRGKEEATDAIRKGLGGLLGR